MTCTPIPTPAAELLARRYGYDQIVIVGRRVGLQGGESCTVWGDGPKNAALAAMMGQFLRTVIMQWAASRWIHRLTRGTYAEIGRGRLQVSALRVLTDMTPLVLYRADIDRTLWARPTDEFEDGRFERIGD